MISKVPFLENYTNIIKCLAIKVPFLENYTNIIKCLAINKTHLNANRIRLTNQVYA